MRLAGLAQSVWLLATGWTVRRSNLGGSEIFAPAENGPGAHPAAGKMDTIPLSRG